ncbi:metallophosphoesterase [Luteolibacter ambystomatis]|uniref:Metallophosphoesterase n=1 Tax=Luteolibacter ambystomatis TaxID=2824561 RepID=A0A975G8H6_9BACT|nr:Ig-like domain-containing protein [Luteolibacter ambystomatis]QUE50660.1 metallophosphoesterase [Luteolibacter ambystomatis]
MHHRYCLSAGFFLGTLALNGATTEFGHVVVVQNSNANTAAAVNLTKGAGSSSGFTITGGNRGDYDLSFNQTNDALSGVVISAIAQNGRDNSAQGDTFGQFYATSSADRNTTTNKYTLALFRAAQGDEININTSFAYFPYSDWYAGLARNSAATNGGANNTFTGHASLHLGTEFVDQGGGLSKLDLRALGHDTTTGILLVNHAKNEDNFALSRANNDGTFTIICKDNGTNTSTYEQDPVAFAFIPIDKVGTGSLIAAGRVNGNGSTDVAGGNFTVSKAANTGEWYLTIPGYTPSNGVLVISPEGADTNNQDNIVSYQWDATNSRFVIQSRDLTDDVTLPGLQNMASSGEDAFSFAFFSTTPAGNLPPEVEISGPVDGATVPNTAPLNIDIQTADGDGSITKIEIFEGPTKIGELTGSPWTYQIAAPAYGLHTYTAKAIDNLGSVRTSTPVTVNVTPPAGSGGLFFDGADDHVAFGDNPALKLQNFTLECWFKREGAGIVASTGSGGVSGVPLIAKGRGESDGSTVDCNYFLGIRGTDNVLCADFEDYATGLNHPVIGLTPVTSGVWHHAAVTFDGTQWKLYLDGNLETTSSTSGQIPRYDSIQHASLGTAMNSTGVQEGRFLGFMDEARIWNYARSSSDIQSSMNTEISAAGGLVARYSFAQSSGTTLLNSAGGSVDGTLVNGPLWTQGYTGFTGPTNNFPTVTLDSPVNGGTATAGQPLTLTASASDTDGTIVKVEFYDGGTKLGESTSAPFSFVWTNPTLGNHNLSVRATDNLGGIGASSVSAILMQPPAGTDAVYFDGVNDYATFGTNAALGLRTFTLETWFKREGAGTPAGSGSGGVSAVPLIAKGRGENDDNTLNCDYLFGIRASDGVLCADFEEGPDGTSPGLNHPVTGQTPVQMGVWQHAAVTYDGTTWRLYLNGNLDGELAVGQPPAWNSIQHAALAAALNSTGVPEGAFQGVLDETRIWNKARTVDEIRSTMNSEVVSASGLVARYAMNEPSGAIIHSSAGTTIDGTLTNGGFRTLGAPLNGDVPPSLTPVSPAHNETGEGSSVNLQTLVNDVDSQHLSVKTFARRVGTNSTGEDFTIIALPDTQYYSAEANGGTAAIYSAQTDWIVGEMDTRNIKFVMHLGDIVDNGAILSQWNNATNAMYRLENPDTTLLTHGMPYSVAVGNHDQSPNGNADGSTTYFNTFFGVHPTTGINHFNGKPYYGGAQFTNNADNNYSLFSAGGLDFILISLEYDTSPDAEDMAWADALLKQYPNRRAIIITHYMVDVGNPAPFSAMGQAIYNALKGNPNLMLMYGGHIHGEGRRTDTYQGRTVHSVLADYQGRTRGGDGWLRILEFSPANNRIHTRTYSPTLNQFETDADSEFDLSVDLQSSLEGFTEVATISNAAPGTTVSVPYTNLQAGNRYEWYSTVSDGTTTIVGPVRGFTTATAPQPPTVSITSPANGASFTIPTNVTLTADAADADGTVAKVGFYNGTTLLGEAATPPYSFNWQNVLPGSYTIFAKATDNAGLTTTSPPVAMTVVDPKPVVTVAATDASAGEFGTDKTLEFTFTRTGDVDQDQPVVFSLGGSAIPGTDYSIGSAATQTPGLGGYIMIPTGQSSTTLKFTVLADEANESNETVMVSIEDNEVYYTGTPAVATGIIADKPSQEWAYAQLSGSPLSGPTEDADADGRANLVEYFMKSQPGNGASSGVFQMMPPAEEGVFKIRYNRGKDLADVTGALEWSSDMIHWHGSGDNDGAHTLSITESVISSESADPQLIEATVTATAGGQPERIFVRLSVH